MTESDLPLFISCPHSGEKIPLEANWLQGIDPITLLRDVDRFVDAFYRPLARKAGLPFIYTPWSRYAIDLNRLVIDVDEDSVQNSKNPSGTFSSGLHWVKTSIDEVLMEKPISKELHEILVQSYYEPFHNSIKAHFEHFKLQGHKRIFHIDVHSMPSQGTSIHRDPGETRAEIVISDQDGKSCDPKFKDLVVSSYEKAGFIVKTNWPYKGGRITQTYGNPFKGRHTIQVEMNRSIYMNEETKELKTEDFPEISKKIETALNFIYEGLKSHVVLLS
ncbi:MAG: N-formylglutamate amidohydrolase [Bdellovibrionales bacterium]